MDPHLTDEQAELLIAELDRIIDGDRYPLSPPQKPYEPPSRGRYRRRG